MAASFVVLPARAWEPLCAKPPYPSPSRSSPPSSKPRTPIASEFCPRSAITEVSSATEPAGHIQFQSSDGNTYRYQIGSGGCQRRDLFRDLRGRHGGNVFVQRVDIQGGKLRIAGCGWAALIPISKLYLHILYPWIGGHNTYLSKWCSDWC